MKTLNSNFSKDTAQMKRLHDDVVHNFTARINDLNNEFKR